jgi:DNA-binding MarR family transcriptional regulator
MIDDDVNSRDRHRSGTMSVMPAADDDLTLAEGLIALGLAVDRLRTGICRELDLTPQQVQLMCALGNGPRTSGNLAALLACDKTNITGLVNRLELRGLVQRVRDDDDRRIVNIALTTDGRTIVGQFRQRAAAAFTAGLAGLSAKQRHELRQATRKAVRALGPDLPDTIESDQPPLA